MWKVSPRTEQGRYNSQRRLYDMTIRLRPTTPADIPFVYETEHAEENRRYIIPWSAEQHLQSLSDPDHCHLIVEEAQSGRSVGYIILAGLQNPHHNLELMRITIGEKGKGYGREALRLIKHRAFEEKGAHRLWLDVKEQNERAKALYVSEGFVVEGTLRECLKTGEQYESLIVLSMLETEYWLEKPGPKS
jgi:diamine N-acetyltransferase